MIVVPLGTSAGAPTRTRHLSSTALVAHGRILLFDCAEGTQMRLLRGGLRHSRIAAVFITHLHGDHYFGLMGLLSTMALARRTTPLVVVAPEALTRLVHLLPGVRTHELTFPLEYVPLSESKAHAVVYAAHGITVEARPLDHRVFAVGYRVREDARPGRLNTERARELGITDYADYRALKRGETVRGRGGQRIAPSAVLESPRPPRRFAYVTDTRPCENGVLLAEEASLLVHEATFTEALRQRAHETGHSTAAQAATVARKAGARKLLLTHFSARFRDTEALVKEARVIMPDTAAARELQRYPIEGWESGSS